MPYIRGRYIPATAQIHSCSGVDTDVQPCRYVSATRQIRTCNRVDTYLQPDRYGRATG